MRRNPLITTIIPVYNCELYVKESILSILEQTYTNFELFVVDDGSTDNTLLIVNDIAKKDGRIRIIKNSENKGQSACMNMAIKQANGNYIARMDADDFSTNDRLYLQVKYLEENQDVFLCGTGVMLCDENLLPITKWDTVYSSSEINAQLNLLEGKIPIKHSSIMYRKNSQVLYRDKITYAQDLDLFLRLNSYNFKMTNIKEVCLYYRQHPNSISQLNHKERLQFIRLVEKFHDERSQYGLDSYNALFD